MTIREDEMVKAGAKQMRAVLNDGGWDDETVFYSALEASGFTALSSEREILTGRGFDFAVTTIETWAQGFHGGDTRQKLEALARDLKREKSAIIAALDRE